jgi:hypothetical protein
MRVAEKIIRLEEVDNGGARLVGSDETRRPCEMVGAHPNGLDMGALD